MGDEALLGTAQELYAGSATDFTAARDAAVKQAADKELAAAVKALRRPTVGAWAVNLLVRRETDQIEQVLGLADSLRAAAQALDGAELRALTRQRRQLTSALTTRARQLALEAGVRLTQAVADQVEDTLTAAMLDEVAADVVRTGLLVTTLAPNQEDPATAVATSSALGTRVTAVAAPTGLRIVPENVALKRESAREQVAAADERVSAARRTTQRAERDHDERQAERLRLAEQIDELQRRLADLEGGLDVADDSVAEAAERRAEARDALAAAEDEAAAAQSALDAL